ncbi:MAG: histidine--tRNA ligase [Negativicutes bacterium]|nr:histidine--tRNA ligase [Negativicutes bacterium]
MLTGAPRGTRDILPSQSGSWQWLEHQLRHTCRLYNYREIRTPVFEHTELFLRGIGDTTDVVSKEMYTFNDRGGRSLTLRPENTAAVVRSVVENRLLGDLLPVKLYYIGPMFRYDRPQAGRFRQFHQFGVEALGVDEPAIDAEVLLMAASLLDRLQLSGVMLAINTIGCGLCRPGYRRSLTCYLDGCVDRLCGDCRRRYRTNPLRVLDCKREECHMVTRSAPAITEQVCTQCREHFTAVLELLAASNQAYTVDSRLVRGLDYYNRTTFEFKFDRLGAQSTLIGGGRDDGLVAELGGQPTPAVGFAAGIERLLLAMEINHCLPTVAERPEVLVLPIGRAAKTTALTLAEELRGRGVACDLVFGERSLRSQLRLADRLGVYVAVLIGDQELAAGRVVLKDMTGKEQITLPAAECADKIEQILAKRSV